VRVILVIVFFVFSKQAFVQNHVDTSRNLEVRYNDTCYKLQDQIELRRLGRVHDQPLIIANGVVVAAKELKVELVDSVTILKWPQCVEKYGDAGFLGVILITTKQKFRTVPIIELSYLNESDDLTNISFAINGFLIDNTSLKISTKAIHRIEVIPVKDANKNETTCVSIWTITGKEIRQYKRRPKACRGVGVIYPNHSY
jgi:hypothetical protein